MSTLTEPVEAVCLAVGSSSRDTCRGIQGEGKNADICCAFECECTCGGSNSANTNKECYVGPIRDSPPAYCTGNEMDEEACSLGPEEHDDTCGVEGITGIANSRGDLCCPIGCGQCGGTGCGSLPMSWVQPGSPLTPLSMAVGVDVDTSSKLFCCDEDITDTICGVDGAEPPCKIANAKGVSADDTCGVSGVEGIANDEGYLCCPIGCPVCGGEGCGAATLSTVLPGVIAGTTTAEPGTVTSDYCCDAALKNSEGYCGDEGVGTPCRLRGEERDDTCFVEGIEGVSDPSKTRCCPIGCDKCTGLMCAETHIYFVLEDISNIGADDSSANYCCDSAFSNSTETCGVNGKKPPCLIPEGTVFPEATPAPGATEPPSTTMPAMGEMNETMSCDTVSVEVASAQTFNGLYTMNGTDATTFVRTDRMAVLVYEIPGDSEFLPSFEVDNDIVTTTDVADETEIASFKDGTSSITTIIDPIDTTTDTAMECGSWLLLYRINGTLQGYPQVSIEDCAEHPQFIDPETFYVTQNGSNPITGEPGMGYIECVPETMSPSPATTMAATMVGTNLSPGPTIAPLPSDLSPESTEMPVIPRGVEPVQPSGGSGGDGLGQTGAVVLGVCLGAALLVGVAGLARWHKRRNPAT